jgi:hypothetical protein
MVASCNTDATAELLLVLEMYRIALFFAHSSKSIDLIAGMLDGLELHARSAFFFAPTEPRWCRNSCSPVLFAKGAVCSLEVSRQQKFLLRQISENREY